MYYIVLDIEATCWENEQKDSETIEIGAVKYNDKLELVDTFDIFIKPEENPILSDFCKDLTSITQEQVDNGYTFNIASNMLWDWMTDGGKELYWLCSWGFYDKKQLTKDCARHSLETAWLQNHISVKHQFADIYGIKPCGTREALRKLGMPFDGRPHRGIDDAKNIGKIFKFVFDKLKF